MGGAAFGGPSPDTTFGNRREQMTAPLLEIRQAEKRFGGLTAVDGVSFSVTEKQIFGIAGPNGSGKSTLFNLITGIPYRPTSGEVLFEGQRIDHWPAHRIARAGLARTFQKDAEFPDLSAMETVLIGAVYGGGIPGRQASSEVSSALDRVGFDPARRVMKSADLSVFEKKQLMIASALVSRPKILMLDEPASGLTKPEIAQLDALLQSLNKDGMTILLIEHVLSLLLSVSQHLMVLKQGAVLAEGDPQTVVADEAVIEAYLGGRSE